MENTDRHHNASRAAGFLAAAVLCILSLSGPARGEEGVTPGEILLGQSCALSGPAKNLGIEMRAGLAAAFSEINAAGGIHGRKIRLISLDDGYEPQEAIRNTRRLIEKERVFLLIGEVGTPTSKAVLPLVEERKIPFFGPFTGAELLRNPFRKWVINLRAGYYQEMERLAAYLVDDEGMTEIACLYQNDSYGLAGLEGIKRALEKRGLRLVGMGDYERNTAAVKSALLKISRADPQAVVMVGAYEPCAAFIKLAKGFGMTGTRYCNISFVGTRSLVEALGDAGQGCIISQVVPFPFDETLPLVRAYKEAMRVHQPGARLGFVSLEGYMVGKLFGMALAAVEGEVTREAFIETLESRGTIDLGGVSLVFGSDDHQGSDRVYLTVIRNGAIEPLEEESP